MMPPEVHEIPVHEPDARREILRALFFHKADLPSRGVALASLLHDGLVRATPRGYTLTGAGVQHCYHLFVV